MLSSSDSRSQRCIKTSIHHLTHRLQPLVTSGCAINNRTDRVSLITSVDSGTGKADSSGVLVYSSHETGQASATLPGECVYQTPATIALDTKE
uniref:Uncharacterized protein n=1 Tax=Mesocestoides corti TaxID=53468 RepID=A0A5K3EPE4_MESCO